MGSLLSLDGVFRLRYLKLAFFVTEWGIQEDRSIHWVDDAQKLALRKRESIACPRKLICCSQQIDVGGSSIELEHSGS